jgi:hypothetical protein
MPSRVREALGWGLVGALAFLVLALAYQLLADDGIALPVLLGTAVVVGVVTMGLSYAVATRLRGNESP